MTVSSSRERVFPFRAQSLLSTCKTRGSGAGEGLSHKSSEHRRGANSFMLTLHGLSTADTRAGQDIFPHKDGATRQLSLLFIVFPSFHIEEKAFDPFQRHAKIVDKLELKINEEEAVEMAQWVQTLTSETDCPSVPFTEPTRPEERTFSWKLFT